ncbi:MAG: hypothetical protein EB136_08365 [Synechococcaceae bacterium WBB_3_034]|jgi:hypothetical protein|nr:hypothetical protein [Synechococcaceae bacterium WBB_3_034]NDG22901.1 hypothetical protein [Synechococcaceae bacterium WBB_10_009]
MKVTAYFQEVVRRKRPTIKTAWIARVLETPLEERQQSDGRYALWGQVPEAQNRVLRVITLDDRETVHNAFFDRGFLRRNPASRTDPSTRGPLAP